MRVLVVCSGGGHLREAMESIKGSVNEFHLATFKTASVDGLEGVKAVHYLLDPHLSKAKYLINAIQAFCLWLRLRPRVIITTGAGIAIPVSVIGKLFGSKLIVVDTVAAVSDLSRTGRFLYKYADLFIVQWPELCQKYPKAIYGGTVL